MFLVFMFGCSKWGLWKFSSRRVCSNVARNILRFLDSCLSVLRLNVDFRMMFKPVKLNLVLTYLGNSCLVDWCFWSWYNYFHLTILLNLCNTISKSDQIGFQDGYGKIRSEVSLQMRWISLRIFYILKAWTRPYGAINNRPVITENSIIKIE